MHYMYSFQQMIYFDIFHSLWEEGKEMKQSSTNKISSQGFPGGAVVENLPPNAGEHEPGFGPWSGKIPHAAERLGPWATIAEPARLEPVPRNGRSRDSERPAHRDEEWPPLAATRESTRTETKTQHSQK